MALITGSEFLVRNAVLKAIKASVPMGKPLDYQGPDLGLQWTDVPLEEDGSIQIHYFQTHSIHIHLQRVGDDVWELKNPTLRPYWALQTWAQTYSTWKALFESVKGVRYHEKRPQYQKPLPVLHKLG